MQNLTNELAEQSVIGGMIINALSDQAIFALEKLRPDDFSLTVHREIWREILAMSARNEEIDVVTLAECLHTSGSQVSFSYLGEISKNTPSQANMRRYAQIVKEYSLLRNANASLHDALSTINTDNESPTDRINKALTQIAKIGADDGDDEIKFAGDVLSNVLTRMEAAFLSGSDIVGVSSGFQNIDAMTGGFKNSELIILAARPSMGKTTLAMNIAENVAMFNQKKGNVLVISLEMSAEQILEKTISRAGGIYLNRITTGKVLDEQIDKAGPARLSQAMEIITKNKNNLMIDDRGGQHISQVQARAKRAKIKMGGLDLVVVDYLGLIQADGENQNVRVSNVSAGLKSLAKSLDCPVLALCQLNRNIVGRPEMKNLRDSGSIEQDADVIIFLHDEDYEGNRGAHSLTELIFAKQRMGKTGSTFLQPELDFSRFADTQRLPEVKQEPEKKYSKRRFDE